MVASSPQPVGGHHRACTLPFMVSRIAAGFPSPADDYVEKQIDLNTHLIQHREATFILRVTGWSMRDAGIFDGDGIIVDRAITPVDGKIVVAAINGDLTVKRWAGSAALCIWWRKIPSFPRSSSKKERNSASGV
ncbi:LexA family protein [Acidithiobacillus ferridurans]|uniref:LexA repressor n=1 Tax=Acidithiobacillus ferridurans TaxID=1232575 RepID=A0A2Z6IG67_ACIFI|nr:translesion error-prone DNA polymerase V autoproteolytic subunit [Acidithiobacillus ferridurans]BBF63784.1 LexA repressor [Acidithiobacillus ferridurans]